MQEMAGAIRLLLSLQIIRINGEIVIMLNREIYQLDPVENQLANNGVAKVKDDLSDQALKVLRYELKTFVCDGEYEDGMERILNSYLINLNDDHEQKCVWISGFFGSGKSHMAKMLRALWVEQSFADGLTASNIAELPISIKDHFKELSMAATRNGGRHAASGTLGAGANNNVRLALLNIIFKSAGLPEDYNLARFIIWLKKENYYDKVKTFVENEGDDWIDEIDDLLMSHSISNALIDIDPTLASDIKGMRQLLQAQFPIVTDVTNTQMVNAITDALSNDGKFPLTLIVLDEVQQYVGSDSDKAHLVQEVVEICSDHPGFNNKLLFVGTGQNALSGMPNLQRLMGRFQINVQLSDTDVESVIRKVILQKKESAKAELDTVLKSHLGEISRQLRGTKIEFHRDDEQIMLADYPVLPIRRRFWEKVLRIVDTTGTVSQLRNQLKVIHEATKETANYILGHVVPGDFIYNQISVSLLQTGVISKEISEMIGSLAAGDDDEKLQSRILSLVLLIGKLPTEPNIDSGVRATADMLADLLIEDLNKGKDDIRTRVPKLLNVLADNGQIMAMQTSAGTEYRLQTQESGQWYDTFRTEEADLRGNIPRIENLRVDLLHAFIKKQIAQVRLTQGNCKEVRQVITSFDLELPRDANDKIYAWVQDGWSVDEKSFLTDARSSNPDLPTIYLYIPARNRSELANAIIAEHAADATLQKRGIPNTEPGKDARSAMETRQRDASKQVESLLKEVFSGVQVLQAGGAEVEGNSITEQVEKAAKASLVRLYRDFDLADNPSWGKVYDRARKDGGQNALEAIGYKGDSEKQPVCAKIMNYLGVSKKGSEIRDQFKGSGYGWPQDAIDGAMFALLASGVIIAKDTNGNPIDIKKLERSKLTQTSFYPETITIRNVDLIKIRGVINACGISCNNNEEINEKLIELIQLGRDLSNKAGGNAPYPEKPNSSLFTDIAKQTGNAQLKLVLDRQDEIKKSISNWKETALKIEKRQSNWSQLSDLLRLTQDTVFNEVLNIEVKAIIKNRSILDDPNPMSHLITDTVNKLRDAINLNVNNYKQKHKEHLTQLKSDKHWLQLTDEQQESILTKRSLDKLPNVDLSDIDSVIESLEKASIGQWNDRTESLNAKFDSARMEAVQLLQPKIQQISLPKVTFETEDDVKAWLQKVETKILAKLSDGPVTF